MRKKALSCLLLGLAVAAAPAAMASTVLMPVQDTVTTLTLDLQWDGATGTAPYNGIHWNAYFTPTFASGLWSMEVWYAHKDGPHGESLEHPGHVLPIYLIAPGGWVQDNGVDDHLGIAFGQVTHANAHTWNIATSADADPAKGGFTAFQVAHVPEPATWLMLAGGLVAVGVGTKRRT
jgi:hypothetical protein